MSRENFILMSVGGLTLDPVTKTPIVILKDSENKLNLPIWIGLLEATAMATELEGIKMARPMTHDLLRSASRRPRRDRRGDRSQRSQGEHVFRADPSPPRRPRRLTIDSRPSDAISLALRTQVPDLRREEGARKSSVLQQVEEGKDQNLSNVARDKWADILEKMAPDDFKYKM